MNINDIIMTISHLIVGIIIFITEKMVGIHLI